jgi:hypothetical protein
MRRRVSFYDLSHYSKGGHGDGGEYGGDLSNSKK